MLEATAIGQEVDYSQPVTLGVLLEVHGTVMNGLVAKRRLLEQQYLTWNLNF